MPQDEAHVLDATHCFPGCVRAERKGDNTLILRKLDEPFRRFDGRRAGYEVEYRWHPPGGNVHSVLGNEFTYWQRKEFDPSKPLFEQFSLIG